MRQHLHIINYLPVRFAANEVQALERQICYDFKDGLLSESVKNEFLTMANSITQGNSNEWVVCFIPASTTEKTLRRYSQLANAFRQHGFEVANDAITNAFDTEAGHLNGKSATPIEAFLFSPNSFIGKKVILIDDVITRGTTFNMTADKLEALGAISVTGLFLAKTVNPDYEAQKIVKHNLADDYYYDYEEDTYDRYHGSYAQDVEGWSDQEIDEVFDGDPDAYWNID